jgi:hypothetical protein
LNYILSVSVFLFIFIFLGISVWFSLYFLSLFLLSRPLIFLIIAVSFSSFYLPLYFLLPQSFCLPIVLLSSLLSGTHCFSFSIYFLVISYRLCFATLHFLFRIMKSGDSHLRY